MALRVSGKNFDIGESLRQHVLDRIDAATTKFIFGTVTGHVVIDHEGSGYRSDCTLHLSSGMSLHTFGVSHEPYASFDQAALRLERRLRRYKGRLQERHPVADDAALQSVSADVVALYTIEAPDHDEPEETEYHPVVIAERTKALKTMPVSAAVAELDLTGVPVLAFRHATTERLNFVYRRADGNIGWLDPAADLTTGGQVQERA